MSSANRINFRVVLTVERSLIYNKKALVLKLILVVLHSRLLIMKKKSQLLKGIGNAPIDNV